MVPLLGTKQPQAHQQSLPTQPTHSLRLILEEAPETLHRTTVTALRLQGFFSGSETHCPPLFPWGRSHWIEATRSQRRHISPGNKGLFFFLFLATQWRYERLGSTEACTTPGGKKTHTHTSYQSPKIKSPLIIIIKIFKSEYIQINA